MGLFSVLSDVVSRLRRQRRGRQPQIDADGRRYDGNTVKAAPFIYALPWQVGRSLAARYSSVDVPRHYAGWVYAAVRAIAQGCAGCDVRFLASRPDHQGTKSTKEGGTGRTADATCSEGAVRRNLGALMVRSVSRSASSAPLLASHPLARLFAEVNPFHTYRELVEITLTDLELSGNAYWVLARGRVSGVPAEIWPVPPTWMRVVPDGADGREGLVGRYVFRRGGRETELDARDVVHFRYTSPGDPYYGRSPLEAAMEAVRADESVARAQRRAFELGPMPGIILKTANPLTNEQRERLRAEFESRFSGPDAAGRLIITDPDADVVPFSSKPREMDFMNSARTTRDRILGCFGVPAAVLGIVEDFNRANAEAAHMLFARSTLLPKLKLIAARITQDVCSQFDPPGIKCDFASPVPADREADRKEMETAVRLGVVSTNEAREDYLGKPGVEGGDEPRPRVPVYELVPRGDEGE